jgi:two-component system, OmpR family, phosphate regulon sensor histidine kinase PhoR
MSISLLGIVYMQIFWIINAVKINEEQFGRNVNEALNELVNKMETDEISQIISGNLGAMDIGNSFEKICGKTDSVLNTNQGQNKSPRLKIVIKNSIPDSLRKKIHINQNSTFIKLKKNDTLKNISATVIRSNYKIDVKTDKFKNVVKKMLVEYECKSITLCDRLQQINFLKILNSFLLNHGIDLPYEFIVCSKNNTDTAIISKGFKTNSSEFAFTVNLFPNDLVEKSDFLKLYFPDRKGYIYRSLSLMIIGSLVFTLFILLTFIVTIFAILRQKKISEIRNDFINNMTHEFKTPIATISLASDSINTPMVLEDREQIKYFSRIIKEESLRMNTKMEGVLQLALFDKNEIEYHFTSLNVHEQIEKAVERIQLQLEQKSGQISTDLKAPKQLVEADGEHLLSAFLNILDNAIKYSAAPPVINILTYNKELSICISISDQGIGIDKDDIKRIFERFYRVHTGDIHNVKGFGLGLCYVKEVINKFKGQIDVQSVKGTGSTFTICLPIKKDEK